MTSTGGLFVGDLRKIGDLQDRVKVMGDDLSAPVNP
jgi:hypothetical protein